MKLTKWTLLLVLVGLSTTFLVDIDHLLINTNGGPHISNWDCIMQGFRSLTTEGAKSCMVNQEYGVAYLHSPYIGLFLFAFIVSYYVVIKNE